MPKRPRTPSPSGGARASPLPSAVAAAAACCSEEGPGERLRRLPAAVLESVILTLALSGVDDLRAFGAVSRAARTLAVRVGADANHPLWQSEFRARDPVLWRAVAGAGDARTPWRARVARLAGLRRAAALDPGPRHDPAGGPTPTLVDVVLYNHPKHGFLVNVGEVRRSVVLYGLRRPPPGLPAACAAAAHMSDEPSHGGEGAGDDEWVTASPGRCGGGGSRAPASSAEALLRAFALPVFEAGAPAPPGPAAANLLVLHSLDGRAVADFADFDELVGGLRRAGELCRWRLLFYPRANLRRLPAACTFATTGAGTGDDVGSVPLFHNEPVIIVS
jgi:hypothetical protein